MLPYEECENPGLYVHIPFCRQLCSFCPYCKQLYTPEDCERYVDELLEEIHLVCAGKARKRATSLYFGGGTPALAADRLGEIIHTLEQYFEITEGIGVELHPADVTKEKLETLKNAGVTKISIGIQSFQPKFLSLLGRAPADPACLAAALKAVPFETVSMDFIFALPGQTTEDLLRDTETAFSAGANHVAVYPFIDFSFTPSQVKPMKNKQKRRLLDEFTAYCEEKGYQRDSVWTFSRESGARYSSMTRECFLGFGTSAVTLLKKQFKINTFSRDAYRQKLSEGTLPTALTLRFSQRQRMLYYLFWQAYSTKVDPAAFTRFFGIAPEKKYGLELRLACMLGFAEKENGIYRMTPKGAFYYHYYENYYTLAYIDKMWSVLRLEAFPEEIRI